MKKYLLILPALLLAIWAYAQSTNSITIVFDASVDDRIVKAFRIWNACQTNGIPIFSTNTNAITKLEFINMIVTNGDINPHYIHELFKDTLILRFNNATLAKQIQVLKILE